MSFHDYDQDGFVDVFIGARSIPWKYGEFPDSYLLKNDGNGNFIVDVEHSKLLSKLGMIRDAVWEDITNDGLRDLIIVGDWFPITILVAQQGGLLKKADPADFDLERSNGYLSSIKVADVNGDDRNDLIIGNLGTNTKIQASMEHPLRMYIDDFDKNGSVEQLAYTHQDGAYKLFYTKDELTSRLLEIKKSFQHIKNMLERLRSRSFQKDGLLKQLGVRFLN